MSLNLHFLSIHIVLSVDMGPKLTHKEKKEKDRLRKAAARASMTEGESKESALFDKGRRISTHGLDAVRAEDRDGKRRKRQRDASLSAAAELSVASSAGVSSSSADTVSAVESDALVASTLARLAVSPVASRSTAECPTSSNISVLRKSERTGHFAKTVASTATPVEPVASTSYSFEPVANTSSAVDSLASRSSAVPELVHVPRKSARIAVRQSARQIAADFSAPSLPAPRRKRPVNRTESVRRSQEEYLRVFNFEENGPLHQQDFIKVNMRAFHDDISSYAQRHCSVCRELWPTPVQDCSSYVCNRCQRDRGITKKFSLANDMVPDLSAIPTDVRIALRKLTAIEQMLLSPVLPIMSVYRLASGGNVSRGYVANFRQETSSFIRKIPLRASEIPLLCIRRTGQDSQSQDFKVNRARIMLVGQFLAANHPGFKVHSVSFSQQQCDLLPEDGFLTLATIEDDSPQQETADEGPVPNERVDTECVEQGYVLEPPVSTTVAQEIALQLDPDSHEMSDAIPRLQWPFIDPQPLNEFTTDGITSLAFVNLFPLGQADPTSRSRLVAVTELVASNHLLKYAEEDPCSSTGELYYPFAENARFTFWMVDRIRRHRALQQSSIFMRKNPSDATLSLAELKDLIRTRQLNGLVCRMHAFTSNIVGSDSYCAKKRRELEAIVQQRGMGTAFFSFSFADHHWHQLHRLMPGGLDRKRLNLARNPHLADWFFFRKTASLRSSFFSRLVVFRVVLVAL